MLKTEGIPLWVTIFALLVFLSGAMASVAIITGTHDVDSGFALSWAGSELWPWPDRSPRSVPEKRHQPIWWRFIGGIFREASDLVGELSKAEPNMGIVAFLVVFLIGGVIGAWIANTARA